MIQQNQLQEQFREIENMVFEGVNTSIRALYYYLRMKAQGDAETVIEGLSSRSMSKDLSMSRTTVSDCLNKLSQLKLIELIKADKENKPYNIKFCFKYENSTFRA